MSWVSLPNQSSLSYSQKAYIFRFPSFQKILVFQKPCTNSCVLCNTRRFLIFKPRGSAKKSSLLYLYFSYSQLGNNCMVCSVGSFSSHLPAGSVVLCPLPWSLSQCVHGRSTANRAGSISTCRKLKQHLSCVSKKLSSTGSHPST